ncbi:hypothetical protein INT47_009170 [Mucor saturninus]|uniref:DUF6570 domain-containing protein n=1 Tax=Mucor saturninus TaxID=64648 RepID=A0A8H7RPK0_9FUNG|nr:hypothetical protein INT47_009170 [Mucor saturninus]
MYSNPFGQWTGAHGQFRHRGTITNVPVTVDTTVTQLPRQMSDTNVIAVKIAKKMTHQKNYMEGNVNVENVMKAALFLMNTERYKKYNITIDMDWIATVFEAIDKALDSNDVDSQDDDIDVTQEAL